jgi:type II secretory pathway pseudopilin PulG
MCRTKGRSRGFTLVASLLVLALLSGIAISLLFMVQGAGQVGGNDLETNQAYYGAESGMELLTANLAALYQQSQSPTPLQLTALANNPPDSTMISSMNYQESITWTPDPFGNPASHTSVIDPPSPNAGLTAEIIPLTLKVVASRPGGASVNMTRGVEVALIPVFQFGVFSDSDLSYFAGPNFNFQGRVHTNGNLFLAEGNGNSLVLDDKVTAVGEIVRDRLANNFLTNANYTGNVYVLRQNQGCNGTVAQAIANVAGCIQFTVPDASWSGGLPPVPAIGANCPAAGAACNANWPNISTTVSPTTFGGWIGNGTSMAVQPLTLPFVQGANGSAQQIQIIRKAPLGEVATSATGSSREYNKASVRILLASNQADLHPERPGVLVGDVDLTAGGCLASPTGKAVAVVGAGTTRIAMATAAPAVGDVAWVGAPTGSLCGANPAPWNLIDGWLRVEYLNAAGAWVGITNEWLQLGFARGVNPPTRPVGGGAGSNPVHPNAILILQEQADRNANGNATDAVDAPNNIVDGGTLSQYSWYPINFFDPREGFPRDNAPPGMANPFCYVNGIMNAVELDVGNFQKWLQGTVPGGNGPLVSFSSQNGYLVYFSDRRGMIPNPNIVPVVTNGEYGFEDVINSASATGTPDGVMEASEDVDQNVLLDRWGAANVGNGLQVATANNPYANVNCSTRGRQNIVTGARHVLKLVDGGLGNLPVRPDNGLGGFTVASENPVYIQGNYNSDNTDPFWGNPPPAVQPDIAHAAAAVIADAVTVLSNNWSDTNSMLNPLNLAGRAPNTPTYYRMAIAGGKNINFLQPAGTGQDFGTDGGVHNFLRYIETWGGSGGLYYRGSLVSLYYSQYATGIFKCCNLVYGPPPRFYYFDNAFLDPTKLPPGTPMLQDVVNLTYFQDFKPY